VDVGYLYPEEVSACILQQLLEDAARHTSAAAPITKAVITVPAYFDDEQRDATIAAGARSSLRAQAGRLN
jgi:molecular chaperone DnaK